MRDGWRDGVGEIPRHRCLLGYRRWWH